MIFLTRKHVTRVRDQLVGLFLEPGQCIVVAPPKGFLVKEVKIYPGMIPMFEYEEPAKGQLGQYEKLKKVILYLRCAKSLPLKWDYQMDVKANEANLYIEPLEFNDPKAKLPRELIRAYAKHFPFVPTNNYFINRGEFVA